MKGDELEPLDPELATLLAAERTATPAQDALDRVWSRVAVVVPPRAGRAAGNGGSRVSRVSGAKGDAAPGWLASHAAGVAMAAFVVGGLVGAGLHAMLEKAPAGRVVYVDRPVAPALASAAPSAPSAAVPTADVSASPPVAHPSARVAAAGPSLAAERQTIDSARAALSSGDAAKALALLDDHARRFPRGQLSEERQSSRR